MADEYDVTFSRDFIRNLEDIAFMNSITALMPEELATQTKAIIRAFRKRGVPAKIVIEVFEELAKEGVFGNGE